MAGWRFAARLSFPMYGWLNIDRCYSSRRELDRESFNLIVRDAAARKREMYESFLKEVKILEGMDPYERSKLGDALKTVEFQDGCIIIREGELGDTFYIIGRVRQLAS